MYSTLLFSGGLLVYIFRCIPRELFNGLMVCPFTWISDEYHVKNATFFCFTCFTLVFFTWITGVPIHVYISSEV